MLAAPGSCLLGCPGLELHHPVVFTNSQRRPGGAKLQKLMAFRRNSSAKDGELKAILTPGQYTLYEQKKSEIEAMVKQKIMDKQQNAQ